MNDSPPFAALPELPVEVYRSHWRPACDERAFMLHAVGIECSRNPRRCRQGCEYLAGGDRRQRLSLVNLGEKLWEDGDRQVSWGLFWGWAKRAHERYWQAKHS